MHSNLDGLRVLLVEDEFINAIFVSDTLVGAGCDVVGPVGTVDQAMALADDQGLDAAILDVNLAGQPVYEVADRLMARNVPVVLTTGYDSGMLPERLRACRRLQKPFGEQELLRELRTIAAGRTG